jgi:uncharacterized protein (TIGR00255 family)
MIRSMTGFGQASEEMDGYKIHMEVKSLNHRYGEVSIRMPKEWIRLEDALRKTTLQTVKRGRVDLFVTVEHIHAVTKSLTVDWSLAESYLAAAEQLKSRFGFEQDITIHQLLALPGLLRSQDEGLVASSVTIDAVFLTALHKALHGLLQMREAEGADLRRDTVERLAKLEELHSEVDRLAPQVAKSYAAKLRERINEALSGAGVLDEQRLWAEVALFADRSNIDEEITRLDSHFKQMRLLLDDIEPVGRKLDFLIQEMNREVNTIGSKAGDALLLAKVIDMKAELEKMREQIQNIE